MDRTATRSTLMDVINYAVPLWIQRLADAEPGRRNALRISWVDDAVGAASYHADDLLSDDNPGVRVYVLNAVARGVAALAWDHGGVIFNGVLWCALHHGIGDRPPGLFDSCRDCTRGEPIEPTNRYARQVLREIDPRDGGR